MPSACWTSCSHMATILSAVERVAGVLGLVDGQMIGRLVDSMATGDAGNGLALINQMVAEGVDLGQLVDQILIYLRAVLFVQVTRAPDALDLSQEVAAAVVRQAGASAPAFTLAAIREFLEARSALREQVPGVPQLPIELAFLRAALPEYVSAGAAAAAWQPAEVATPSGQPFSANAPVVAAPAPKPVPRGKARARCGQGAGCAGGTLAGRARWATAGHYGPIRRGGNTGSRSA